MKKSTIFIDAAILLSLSTLLAVGINEVTQFFKGQQIKDSPIIQAVSTEKKEQDISAIIEAAPDSLIHKDEQGRSPMIRICNINLKDDEQREKRDTYISGIVRLMIEKGANIEDKDQDGWTALCWASWSNLPQVTEALLSAGADRNVTDRKGNTPLSIAQLKKNEKIVELLESK